MEPALHALAAQQGGVILRPQALDAGYTDKEIARLISNRKWTSVRRGAYIERDRWEKLSAEGRHRAKVHAVARQLSVPAVVSHTSAAILSGLPVWGVDLSAVDVTRMDLHTPRKEAGVHHHSGELFDDDITAIEGLAVTSLPRTAVDIARTESFEAAIVTVDAALHELGLKNDVLLEVLDKMRDWRGARQAGRVTEFADGRSESPGESRHRVQIRRIGLPKPDLQVTITVDGWEFRVDFLFEDFKTIGEFDGRDKYGRYLAPGETEAEAVWREKRREDGLRSLGYGFVRPTWVDLDRDDIVASRYSAAFQRARSGLQ